MTNAGAAEIIDVSMACASSGEMGNDRPPTHGPVRWSGSKSDARTGLDKVMKVTPK